MTALREWLKCNDIHLSMWWERIDSLPWSIPPKPGDIYGYVLARDRVTFTGEIQQGFKGSGRLIAKDSNGQTVGMMNRAFPRAGETWIDPSYSIRPLSWEHNPHHTVPSLERVISFILKHRFVDNHAKLLQIFPIEKWGELQALVEF